MQELIALNSSFRDCIDLYRQIIKIRDKFILVKIVHKLQKIIIYW